LLSEVVAALGAAFFLEEWCIFFFEVVGVADGVGLGAAALSVDEVVEVFVSPCEQAVTPKIAATAKIAISFVI
jgi:hypothetical protein